LRGNGKLKARNEEFGKKTQLFTVQGKKTPSVSVETKRG